MTDPSWWSCSAEVVSLAEATRALSSARARLHALVDQPGWWRTSVEDPEDPGPTPGLDLYARDLRPTETFSWQPVTEPLAADYAPPIDYTATKRVRRSNDKLARDSDGRVGAVARGYDVTSSVSNGQGGSASHLAWDELFVLDGQRVVGVYREGDEHTEFGGSWAFGPTALRFRSLTTWRWQGGAPVQRIVISTDGETAAREVCAPTP